MAADTRDRMIDATVAALRRHGVAGMSFTEVLKASGAARGAIYHHFPGGKAQLVAEAAERNGQDVHENLAALPSASPAGVVEAFVAAVRPVAEQAAGGCGCAVAAVTLGADTDQDAGGSSLREVAQSAFASWIGLLAQRLTEAGLESGPATDLAATLIALLEGAQVLCRAAGSLEPFDRAARTATALARTLPQARNH
jgi:TetR/AcrR family transcriptional repressor of lmrAB and yxaGH operons